MITEAGLRDLIRYHTREAGVRNLEREIANLTRKAVKEIVSNQAKTIEIAAENLGAYAGVRARWGGYAPPPAQQAAGGYWVVLTRREHDAWAATAGPRLGPATLLTSNGQKYYLSWLAKEGG